MSEAISSGRPRQCSLIRTRNPYLLFKVKADDDYVIRLKYLSKNRGTNAAGTSEVLEISAATEIPLLPDEYHALLVYLTGAKIAGELANLKNDDGSLRFKGMAEAAAYFEQKYADQLAKDLAHANHKIISRKQASFKFSGSELEPYYY